MPDLDLDELSGVSLALALKPAICPKMSESLCVNPLLFLRPAIAFIAVP